MTDVANMLGSVGAWVHAHLEACLRILLMPVGAYGATRLAHAVTRRIERLAEDDDPTTINEREKRARTLARILRQSTALMIWTVTGMMMLGELGLDIKPLLAGAGIVGLAIGFGAQTLVKDLIAGFFILLENQFRVNDVIEVSGVAGLVEAINLRTTVLRDIQGRVHVIPNGSIDVVTNFTREWSRALVDVGVAYKEDTDICVAALREVGDGMERDPVFGPKLLDSFEYPGVEQLGDSAVVLRMMVRTLPQEQWNVLRELRRRIKKAFDRRGIEIPFPHHTVYFADAPDGTRLRMEPRMTESDAAPLPGKRR